MVDEKTQIQNIIKIYETYPPLTSRVECQLAFIKDCLINSSVKPYLMNRNLKYENQSFIIKSKIDINTPIYFKEWLSGFIEAEGCFSIRKSNNHSFSIGQNDDYYLISIIRQYLGIINKIKNPSKNFYFLEVYKKEILLKIITHCSNYPLLGEKSKSFSRFIKII